MPYRIRPGLSYCACEDCPIFLDIDAGRYSTLPDELRAPFAALMCGEGGVASRDIERLRALRVVEESADIPDPIRLLPKPSCEVAPTRSFTCSVAALVAQGRAIRNVRHMPLRKLFALEAARRP